MHFPIRYQERGVLKNIEQIVEKQSGESRDSCNIFWIIIPNNFKTNYSSLKKIVLRAGIEKNSQICLTSTFQKKGFNSVMTKILLQMAAKVGNTLWLPKISSSIPSAGVMMIGIEEYADSFHPGRTVLSFCSNTNRECSSFHSNFLMHSGSKTHINEIVIPCLSEYLRCSNEAPSDILIIKNGSSKYDNPLVVQTEVAEIKEILKSVKKE